MNKKILLLVILLISLATRFWNLSRYPVSLSIDEVIIGYDAYSILKTGKDHWGEPFPLAFRSVDDYKAPVLIYLMVPAIKLLGLNEWGIRFTVALFGALTPLVVFFLVEKILGSRTVSFFTAFSLAISPWHIQYSRASFEAILALFFFLAGVTCFLASLEKRGKWWWLSGILFSLSIYSYHSQRLFTPLFLLLLFFLFKKQIWQFKKKAFLALAISFLLLLPFVFLMVSGKGQSRAQSVFFTNDYELRVLRLDKLQKGNFLLAENILSGSLINSLSFWANRYLEYSDSSFLFFKGMNLTHPKFPDVGLMHFFELPFFVGGLVVLVNRLKLEKEKKRLVFLWLILGPLPASLTNNSQHPLRSLTTIPIPQLIAALGFWYFLSWLRRLKIKRICQKLVYLSLSFGLGLSLLYYFDLYFVHYPVHYSHYWMYGMKEIAQYVWKNKDKYEQIIVDADFGVEAKDITGIPFAYILTYGQEDPRIIQAVRQNKPEEFGFENFVFRSVYWPEDRKLKKTLLVASFWQLSPEEIPPEKIIEVIPLYNRMPMFYLVETQ